MTTTPNACPFCNDRHVVPLFDASGHYVFCWHCYARGPVKPTKEEAESAWGKIATNPVFTVTVLDRRNPRRPSLSIQSFTAEELFSAVTRRVIINHGETTTAVILLPEKEITFQGLTKD